MTTTENTKSTKSITITMSETAPIKIDPKRWPKIASASNHDGKVECQANTEWFVGVREHDDGRRVVYGWKVAGNGGQYAGFRSQHAGFLIDVPLEMDGPAPNDMSRGQRKRDEAIEEQTIRAIRRVAGVIGDEDLGSECIADLPAQEI